MLRAGARIHIVDDDPLVGAALAGMLRKAGLVVETFTSPTVLLERDPALDPDCLVVDLRMPGMSGLELQQALAVTGRHVPVVFMSGAADVPSSVQAMRNGAVDFLQKPFDGAALLEAVRRAVEAGARAAAERARRDDARERMARLTPRERQVCTLVVQGMINKQIASLIGAAEHTVKVHRAHAMAKLGISSVPDLVRLVDLARQA
jgi:FixJ family two-component response regulator